MVFRQALVDRILESDKVCDWCVLSDTSIRLTIAEEVYNFKIYILVFEEAG